MATLFLCQMPVSHAQDYSGPLYDAHAHFPRGTDPTFIQTLYQKAGIAKAVLFVRLSDAAEAARLAATLGPDFLLFADAHKGRKKGRYRVDLQRLARFETGLDAGTVKGFGELYWTLGKSPFAPNGLQTDFDRAEEADLLRLAAARGLAVHIHDENLSSEDLARIKAYPQVTFILAHAGYQSPERLAALFAAHDNLYAELSLISNAHFGPFKGNPPLKVAPSSAWLGVLSQWSTRFLVGSDIGANAKRMAMLPQIMSDYRRLLGHLPKDVAENIAYRNFERLFLSPR
ncbi:MAG: amidohydrolase family protein [Rhodospirillaceae bacterium]